MEEIGKVSNPVWKFFASVKLTIVFLVLLAIFSVAGTMIPQKEGAMEFVQRLNPTTFNLMDFFGLFDLYHAGWFRFLIAMLVLNLVVCSLERFPSAWKRVKARPSVERTKPFEELPDTLLISTERGYQEALGNCLNLFKKRFSAFRSEETGYGTFFLAEKGRFSYLGVYIVHLSVLVILIGALAGSFFGFEGFVKIPEGETVDSIMVRGGNQSLSPGFEIRCDRFTVEFYENGSPKEYKSEVTFLSGGKEIEKRDILVNHPATFKGITFYQSTYEKVAGKELRIKLRKGLDEDLETIDAEIGKKMELPGKEGFFQILDVRHMGTVPAALVSVEIQGAEPTRFWIFEDFEHIKSRLPAQMINSPKFDPAAFKPYTFLLLGVQERYATGLQANQDPGVPVVWAGFILIILGFIVTFFTSHQTIRMFVENKGKKTVIRVTGSASRNRPALDRDIQRLAEDIRSLFAA